MRSNAREQEQTGITLWQLHRSKRFNHPSDQTRFIVYLRNLVRRVGGTDLWCVGARCCVDHLRYKSRTLRWNWKRVWVTPRTNVYHSHFSMYDVTWLFWFKVHNLSRIGMTLFHLWQNNLYFAATDTVTTQWLRTSVDQLLSVRRCEVLDKSHNFTFWINVDKIKLFGKWWVVTHN